MPKQACLLAVTALGFCPLFILGCGEKLESHYSTLDEAKQRGAISRGWIPDVLPVSSTQIHEKHDVDTNEVWGTFSFRIGESIRESLVAEVGPRELAGRQIHSPHAAWWPAELTGGLDEQTLGKSGLSFYKTAGPNHFYLALDSRHGRGYFWSAP